MLKNQAPPQETPNVPPATAALARVDSFSKAAGFDFGGVR
jgi:hypothetical protein